MSELSAVLPEGWAWANLGELGTWTGGGTPSKINAAFWKEGTVPWVSPKDMKSDRIRTAQDFITEDAVASSSAKYVPENSVLMVTRSGILAHTFPVAVNDCRVAINQDLKALTPFHGADADYIRWYLRSQNSHVLKVTAKHGTTVASIDTDRLHKLRTPIAPSNEQRRIVEKIEVLFAELDKGEESLREVQKLLARYRQSVLKAAVTGQLTAGWRAENAHRLEHGGDLLERVLQTRRSAWKGRGRYNDPQAPSGAELPELPDGWVWASVDQVVGVFRNGLSKKPTSERNEFPILRISATRAMSVSLDDVRYYPATDNAEVEPYWVEQGDLLFTRYSGSAHFVGVCGQMRSSEPVLHPDKLIKARPVASDRLSTDYLELAWNAGETRRHIAANIKTTSGQQGIAGGDIKAAPFPLPPAEEQVEIAERVLEAFDRVAIVQAHCEIELVRSSALRQSILKDAFTGRLAPQDPDDEPAAELLARIRASKAPKPRRKDPR